MKCKDCEQEFDKPPHSPGYINQCLECANDVEKVAGRLIGSHKDALSFEITTSRIIRATKPTRFGLTAGVVTPPPHGHKVITFKKRGKDVFYTREE